MNVLKVIGTVAAIWGLASVLVAIGWAVARNVGWRGVR
jgi:hypothetical protein